MQKREGRSFAPPPTIPTRPDLGRTGRKGLPPQAALPPLTAALSRRAALFGAVTVAGVTAAAAVPAVVQAAALSANDARLVAIAAELLDVDTRANALEVDTPEYDALIDRYTPLESEMAELPADTLAGLLAKARTARIQAIANCVNGIDDSIVDDLLRLYDAGAMS